MISISSGKHLLDVITDILDISKIEAQEVSVDDEIIDINAVAHAALRLAGARAKATRHWASIDIADGLPKLKGDEHLIKQVLVNLLRNAIKFTGENGDIYVWVQSKIKTVVWMSLLKTTGSGCR